ncbi:MAG: carboxypeptidase regulatory-like domain-containing protein [Acidobacteriota bacterium]
MRLWVVLVLVSAPSVSAQTLESARLQITVVDPTRVAVAGATVTVVGIDDTTRRTTVAPVVSDEKGVATIDGMTLGRYSLQAAFPGFDSGLLRDVTLRRGDNRHVLMLALKTVVENVTVGGGQDLAASRTASSFGHAMSDEEIQTLSDDPAELRKQLLDLAGPDATIRIDSFEGGELPAKSQIKSVHVTRDQFAAEAAVPGSTFVDVITQPGTGGWSGVVNAGYRGTMLQGISRPFVSVKQPDQSRNLSGTIGGTLIPNRSDFSVALYGQDQYSSPILNQPGSPARILPVRQGLSVWQANGLVNYALTRDQTVRIGLTGARQRLRNQGVGAYDSPERSSTSDFTVYQIRLQEAGPVGRRTFQNTRLQLTSIDQTSRSALEAPTIVIQDSRTTGGAQVTGGTTQRSLGFASDVDYIRGIHSWRAGVQVDGSWFDSDANANYLGTYTFANEEAFSKGTPLLFTQSVGDPTLKYLNVQTAVYLQDDLRVSKALTVSPGVRYLVQTHVKDKSGVAPRIGLTWSPFKSGATTLRVSAGLFYWPMEMGRLYEQTLRYDGRHQRQVVIVNPTFPNLGPVNSLPSSQYLLGDFRLQRNLRYSAGIDHRFLPHLRANVLYAYWHQFQLWRAENLNAPIDGIRPDPEFANVLVAVTDAALRRHDLTAGLTMSLLGSGAANSQSPFNWRRLSLTATYGLVHGRQNSDGPFFVPPTGDLGAEWGPQPADSPYRVALSLTSTQLRNLNVNVSWTANAGSPYTLTTGVDDNMDGIINDRPKGVALRSLRTSGQASANLRLAYTLVSGGGTPVGASPDPGARRYRLGLTLNATNITNHMNFGGYSGNMQSPYFQHPTFVMNPRRVDFGLTVGF